MTDQPTSPVHGWTADRLALFKRVGGAFLVIFALLVFRALTADDGTHGIKAGECVAAVGSDDFQTVECSDPASLGTVTFVQTDTATDAAAVRALCLRHGASNALHRAGEVDGIGTVVCFAEPRQGLGTK